MTVNLSPVGGAAGQFFDNNGAPLSGGKIYTYAAGSSTPAATYTSASGGTAHTNPIVLDSGGRVPSGEIWLTDNIQYKFVIKTSADVLIGTYDNVSLPVNAADILYISSGTGAVATTVQAKLRQTVSVMDFGADPTGHTSSLAAFNLAAATNSQILVPEGIWNLPSDTNSGTWVVAAGATFTGSGILVGNTVRNWSAGGNYIQQLLSTYQTTSQLIGQNISQGLYQSGTNNSLQFGSAIELFTPSTSTTIWNGALTSGYASINHFGSGALDSAYGGSYEAFNSGTATATLICGVNGNAWNGGVNAGYPNQIPTNDGNATNLRGVSGFAANISSGTVTYAAALYANTVKNTGSGSIANVYGLAISDQTYGVVNYSIATGLGIVSFGDAVNFKGRTSLPAATSGTNGLWIASGVSSPAVGRIYVGDGSGWRVEFAKRNASTDSVVGWVSDSGQIAAASIASSGPISCTGNPASLGDSTGGSVTQLTSKNTSVTLNTTTGVITTHDSSLAAGAVAGFAFINDKISQYSVPIVVLATGSTINGYSISVDNVQAGACSISIKNTTASPLAETLKINFVLLLASAT